MDELVPVLDVDREDERLARVGHGARMLAAHWFDRRAAHDH
jgi:hypothetical protein